MSTTRKEYARQRDQADRLTGLGFTRHEAEALRRISMTLQRWFEQECGDSNERSSWAIERDGDEPDSKPYRVTHWHYMPGKTPTRTPIADRETGARKRLAAIVDRCNKARLTFTTAGEMDAAGGLALLCAD